MRFLNVRLPVYILNTNNNKNKNFVENTLGIWEWGKLKKTI